jgi:hypothetical protein
MEANAKAFPQFLHVTIQFAIRPCSERSLVDGINGWNTRNGVLARKFAGKLRSRYGMELQRAGFRAEEWNFRFDQRAGFGS